MLRNITVGLDGSPESLAAADWAAREAQLRDTPLRLVHAWRWQPRTHASLTDTPIPWPLNDPRRDWAERLPARLTERHPGLRVSAERSAEWPVTALLAASGDADLLVLGSRGPERSDRVPGSLRRALGRGPDRAAGRPRPSR